MSTTRWLFRILTILLTMAPPAFSQAGRPRTEPGTPLPTIQSLKVIPLAGDGEINDLERKVMSPMVIQVLDQNGRPVEGANVVFRFPLEGPSATYPNNQNSQKVRTNADGQAAATGWMANNQTGKFEVRATASRGNEFGEAVITMTNSSNIVNEPRRNGRKRWWKSRWLWGGVAAAAVTSAILLTRGDDDSSTITITPGDVSIGGL